MSLIQCPACSKQVSSRAANCPNCGQPIAPQRAIKKSSGSWLIRIVVAIGIIMIIGIVAPIVLRKPMKSALIAPELPVIVAVYRSEAGAA